MERSGLETLWKIYENVQGLIRHSDAKAGAILVADGAIATILLSNVPVLAATCTQSAIVHLLILAGSVLLFLSAIFAGISIIPAVDVGDPASLIYFNHIAHFYPTYDAYAQAVKDALDRDTIRDDLSRQVWIISKVAQKKYRHVARSIGCFGFSLLVFMVSLGVATLAI